MHLVRNLLRINKVRKRVAKSNSIEDQRKRHVLRAEKAGLGPLIKKNRDKMDDSYTGSKSYYDSEKAKSDQVIKGYFSGNLRSKKRIADEQDMGTDEENAITNLYRDEISKRYKTLQETYPPQKITKTQVTPGKWIAASNLKGK